MDERQRINQSNNTTNSAKCFGTSDRCQVLPAIRHKIPILEPTDITDTTVAHRHAKVNSDATAPEGRESLEGERFGNAAENARIANISCAATHISTKTHSGDFTVSFPNG